MKKIITLTIAILISILSCVTVSAIKSEMTVITIDNVDVEFAANSSLTDEQKLNIAEKLVLGNEYKSIESYGLACTLFGHKYTTENVTTIDHCVSSTQPRCLQSIWEVSICSRCDDTVETLSYQTYIYCCS
jgi:hypothetical protein